MRGTPSCLFEVDEGLLLALEAAFGPPIDSYLRGWQVWLVAVEASDVRGEGGDEDLAENMVDDLDEDLVELEYRLHPPAGFAQPRGLSHHDLWDRTLEQVADAAAGGDAALEGLVLELGEERRDVASLWELLEVFPAFGEQVTPDQVRRWAEAALGRPALAFGYVEHERLGGAFKRLGTRFDLPGALRAALDA